MNYKKIEVYIGKYLRYIYIFFLLLFLANTIWIIYAPEIAYYGMTVLIPLYIYFLLIIFRFKRNVTNLVVNYEDKTVKYKKEANLKAPMPYAITDIHGTIKWVNNKFKNEFDNENIYGENISSIFQDINIEEIIEEKVFNKQLVVGNKTYRIEKNIIKSEEENGEVETLIAIYFIDNTELNELKDKYDNDEVVFAYFFIDNYQEVIESIEELKGPMLLGIIERRLGRLAQEVEGIIKKIDRDKFMLVFRKKFINYFKEAKFEILEEMRKINIGNEFPVTISIGVGIGGNELIQTSEYAKEALELALGRGGDQAVIKENTSYEFYGGKNKKDVENTITGNARARIKAFAFKEIVNGADRVIIMGHRNPDLDCLGAALGVYRAVNVLGKQAHIVLNEVTAAIESLFERIESSGIYDKDTFIKTSEALQKIDKDTLLVIVDVNQPNYVEAPKLLDEADKVVVFDHHIKGEISIENPILIYQEAYASSTSELVTHLLQYIADKVDIEEVEADALIAGIIVDTKNFIFKTGVKTFEAAAYLRRNGADSTRVKKLFQNDFNSYKARAEAIGSTEIFEEHFAISEFKSRDENDYLIISQLADELLSITGVKASFVVCQIDPGNVIISARSLGEVNVEIIAERLGGGGHFTAAGAQLKSKDVEDVKMQIKNIINEIYKKV